MTRNCTACHGSRVGNEYMGKHEDIKADVHFRQGRMQCVDCHDGKEMHGYPQDCETCHRPGTYGVPAPEGAVATIIEATGTESNVQALLSYSPPATACLACHEEAPHLIDENGFDASSCASCHGSGKQWGFDVVHD